MTSDRRLVTTDNGEIFFPKFFGDSLFRRYYQHMLRNLVSAVCMTFDNVLEIENFCGCESGSYI